MKNLLYILLCCTLLLAGCSKDLAEHTPAGTPENNAALFLAPQHFYGTAYSDLVTKGVAQADKLWPAGATITVKFLNDDFNRAAQVEEWAKEWEQYANITFDFVDPSQEAQVRIGFDWNDNRWITWSYIGTDCLSNTDQGDATISYAFWDTATPEEIKGDVLRTFGQVLGLELEHRHLDFNPGWVSEAQVRKFWTNDIEDIPWSDLQKYVYTPLEQAGTLQSENYDPQSIMIWPFGAQYAVHTQKSFNYELSDTDKAFIATIYPEETVNQELLMELTVTSGNALVLRLTVNENILIDWGDGTQQTVSAPFTLSDVEHAYGTNGNYTVQIFGQHSSLNYFQCKSHAVSHIDFFDNPNLKTLSLDNETIDQLDISRLTGLTSLYIYSLPITEINTTQNTELTTAYFRSIPVTEMDFSQNTLLKGISLYRLPIERLNFSDNPDLQWIDGAQMPLTEIDITRNTNLYSLFITECQLTEIDISHNPLLQFLNLSWNPLTRIDLRNSRHLYHAYFNETGISELDLRECPMLELISLNQCPISELDVRQNHALRHLLINHTQITDLDVSNNFELIEISMEQVPIRFLDLFNNPNLAAYNGDGAAVYELDFTNNPEMEFLSLFGSEISNNPDAMMRMAETLPSREEREEGMIFLRGQPAGDWIREICNNKNWIIE